MNKEEKPRLMRDRDIAEPYLKDANKGDSIYFLEVREWSPARKEWGNWEAYGLAKDYDTAITKYTGWIEECPEDKIRIIKVEVIGVICKHTSINGHDAAT